MRIICRVIGRSEGAIAHAQKNILFQQLLHHDPLDVCDEYSITYDTLESSYVDPKYYVALNTSSSVPDDTLPDNNASSTDSSDPDDEYDDAVSYNATESCDACARADASIALAKNVANALGCVIAAGFAYYCYLLQSNWLKHI